MMLGSSFSSMAAGLHSNFTWVQTAPNTIQFTNTSTGNVAYSFWTFGFSGGAAWAHDPLQIYNIPGTYTVQLLVIDTTSMAQDSISQVVTVTGSIICTLQTTVSTLHSSCPVCPDGSAFVDTRGGTEPYTYSWSGGGGTSAYLQNVVAGTYFCLITDAFGCSVYDTAVVPSGAACEASFVWTSVFANNWNASTTSTGTSSVTSFIWSINGQTKPGSHGSMSGYQGAGMCKVCLTIIDSFLTGGCNNTYCDSILITGSPACSASFTLSADTANPGNYTAVNTADFGAGVRFLFWYWGDGSVDSTLTPSHTYATAGVYSICMALYDMHGCSSTYCDTIVATRLSASLSDHNTTVNVLLPATHAGIPETTPALNAWEFYPNPSSGVLQISYSLNRNAPVTIHILNMLGQEVMQVENKSVQEEGSYHLSTDLSGLPPGSYLVRITTDQEADTKRLMIIR
ncbi:MAG TPA: PKD domain-containing protein [Bacteroidia bacterium]|nr:PKD domain-containing protein [Bacteroidia bacterium]